VLKENMMSIKIGDKVRIKDRKGWPTPPGFKLANSEGTVVKMQNWIENVAEFPEYHKVRIDKTNSDVKIGTEMIFREENLEKI
jgi:hypothetical protein